MDSGMKPEEAAHEYGLNWIDVLQRYEERKKKLDVKKIFDNRYVPCYNCQLIGKTGKDSMGFPIAYCLSKNIIVDPAIGCNTPKLIINEETKNE